MTASANASVPTVPARQAAGPSATRAAQPGDQIRAGIALIHRLLGLEVECMRAAGVPVGEDDYRGLYTSDAEADRLLRVGPVTAAERSADDAAASVIAELAAGPGPLGRLARLGGLSTFELGVIILALASEADPGIERLIGYVQDDVTKRRPRVELAARLLPGGADVPAAEVFAPSAPLRRLRLVSLHDEPGQPHTPLAARYIALESRVAGFLLGSSATDEALHGHARLWEGEVSHVPFAEQLMARLRELGRLPATSLQPPVIALACPDPAGRRTAARLVGGESSLPLLSVDLPGLCREVEAEPAFVIALREAALQPAAVLLDGVDELEQAQRERLEAVLATGTFAPLVFLGSARPGRWAWMTVVLPGPEFDTQQAAWAAELGPDAVEQATLDGLAARFRLPADAVAGAVESARGMARWRDPSDPRVTAPDLYAAARAHSAQILNDLAKKVSPHYRWEDIILPADAREQLREMCAYVEHSHRVYETWGLSRRLATGRGLMALFAGQSGTGKTMAADVIAGELGLDLYKIDLSGVVSKYIGETEKNLSTIFNEAATSNAVLFFDEADALFGKRSDVKDAHDRYANIETAYLLQQMEEYSGVVVLATNLKMNIDEAFLRRLHFVIDFPMPGEDDRRRIWESTVPADLPLAEDVDFSFLARQFRIAGGNIRNIVLAAAFGAARDDSAVTMAHFIRGVRREYQKLGRMVTDAEFGPYVGLIRPEPG